MAKTVKLDLTDEQWVELVAALESKIWMLEHEMIPGNLEDDDSRWIEDLKELYEQFTDQLVNQGITY